MDKVTVSGPMFHPGETEYVRSVSNTDGGHYNNFALKHGKGFEYLRLLFPKGEADELNFVLFSTSGVHGTYTSIEEVERGLQKYGDDPEFEDDWPEDYYGNELTVLIVQPRVCSLYHGNITVALADIDYLKRLRQSSWNAVQKIGID